MEGEKKSRTGELWVSVGALGTILSLTVIDNADFKLVSAAIGFIFVIYGFVVMTQKEEVEE